MLAVFKREFKAYFQSVIGWLFVAAVLALFGLYFYVYNLMQGYPYIYYPLSAITIIFLFAVPILTMRSFAEDRKNKTDQLMLVAPVPLGKIVAGKYLAMVAVFTIDIIIFCFAPILLGIFGTVPYGECYIAIFAFWLYGCSTIAVGMFISALTESQVIAAVLTFAVLFVSYMMNGITGLISSSGNIVTKILNCFDLYSPFESFEGGCLDLTSLLYYLTVIVLFCFLTVQSIQKRRWSMSKKTLSTGVFSVTTIAVACALAVVVNLVASVIPSNFTALDFSYAQLYSITDDTKEAMAALNDDITIYALVSENSKDAKIDGVLSRYEDLSNHIKVKYIDPSSQPYFYQDYTDSAPTTNSLIVVSDARSRVIDYYDIYDYEQNIDYSTYSYTNELVGFDAEGQLTSAIQYVTMDSEELPVIYQITGHDESSVGSDFTEAITKANMTLSSIELLNEDAVPDDAEAIIINAPQTDFNAADAQKVIDYLAAGGKAIIIGSYSESELTNFNSILEAYDVSFTKGVIAENDSQYYYKMGGPFYLLPSVNSSDYTSGLSGSYIYVPASVGITYPEETEEDTESADTEEVAEATESEESTEDADAVDTTISYTSLADTSSDAVAKNNPNEMQDYGYEDGDEYGPFSVGLSVEQAVDSDNTTQIVVFGSPYVFSDEASQLTANNPTLFSDVISVLVPETGAGGNVIPEKSFTLGNITVSALYSIIIGIIFMFVVPIVLLGIGIAIFVIRRKK
jgi:ABC-2 type transport system permease protein